MKKFYFEKLFELVGERHKSILLMTQMFIAILVIASFNEKLLPTSNMIKGIIVFLFTLLPITLFDYTMKLKQGLNELSDKLEITELIKKKNWLEESMDGSNYLYVVIMYIVVCIVIYLIVNLWWISYLIFLGMGIITYLLWKHYSK